MPDADPDVAAELERCRATFLYQEAAFLVDEILELDRAGHRIRARLDTKRPLAYTALQRVTPTHPAHVSGAEMIMMTGTLGCLHGWFFHGCRWAEGWSAFGNRIHRADFKKLAPVGPPMELESRETRRRVGARRIVLRFDFAFRQEGELVYAGDQTAMFVRGHAALGAAP